MSYVTSATAWLSDAITPEAKRLVEVFYELADSKAPDAGHQLATEVFTDKATFVGPSETFRGAAAPTTEISKCRDGAWAVVTSRRHTVSKVFAASLGNSADDTVRSSSSSISRTEELVVLGSAHVDFVNVKSLDAPFAAHIVLERGSPSGQAPLAKLRVGFMEIFSDKSPFAVVLATK